MSLLSYNELVELVEQGVIDAPIENINGSSIDITLHHTLLAEAQRPTVINLAARDNMHTRIKAIDCEYPLQPGEFILASSAEVFNLPRNISAEYKLKSTMARNGLEHLNAGWCDAGWNNSRLTLELKNMTRYHTILLTPGMKIGQMVFFRHPPVPANKHYGVMGQYNNQSTVTGSKGLR